MIGIREYQPGDWPVVREMFRQVTAAGDSFAYDADTPEDVARKLWVEPPARAWMAEMDGRPVGTYYVRPNQPGRGAHVANAGYIVSPEARGTGLATILCEHSIESARSLGYKAMQFNFVVATNMAAVKAWQKCGFEIVGRLPGVFRHEQLGLVDALVFHRFL